MTLVPKQPPNKHKPRNSGGPVTEAGKKRVSKNALKHGLFSQEKLVREDEKPEYEALRLALHEQYAPSTVMQQVAFERIVWSTWRLRQANRVEMQRLNAYLEITAQRDQVAEGAEEKPELPRWYSSGPADLRAAEQLLTKLRADVQQNGWHHAEQWKEALTRTFGGDFYDSLTNWSPGSVDAIRIAEYLTAHAGTFVGAPPGISGEGAAALPGISREGAATLPGISGEDKVDLQNASLRARWEMMVKLIDLKLQEVRDLRLLLDLGGSGGDSQSLASLESISRYFTTAGRDLERAVFWFQWIRQEGL